MARYIITQFFDRTSATFLFNEIAPALGKAISLGRSGAHFTITDAETNQEISVEELTIRADKA